MKKIFFITIFIIILIDYHSSLENNKKNHSHNRKNNLASNKKHNSHTQKNHKNNKVKSK